MFKVIALVGAIAGGATYGLYSQTDVFGGKCNGGGCLLETKKSCCEGKETATPSCCANPCPTCTPVCDECPACETGCASCCDTTKAVAPAPRSACCATTAVSEKSPCCATASVSAKKASCCADPCPQCATACEECCPACPTVCGACCGVSAKAAVAGPAAALVSTAKK